MYEVLGAMRIDPGQLAVLYYFGDLEYWQLPQIAADALEEGYDGPALRALAGLANLNRRDIKADDIRANDIDAAFCEMAIKAPIKKDQARLVLAAQSARKALNGKSNLFDEATHVRVHLCELTEPPDSLRRIVDLSKESRNAPRSEWGRIEADLKNAFADFLSHQSGGQTA